MTQIQNRTLLHILPFLIQPLTLNQKYARWFHLSTHIHKVLWRGVDRCLPQTIDRCPHFYSKKKIERSPWTPPLIGTWVTLPPNYTRWFRLSPKKMRSKYNVLGPKKVKHMEDRVETRSQPNMYTTQPTMRTCMNAPLPYAHVDTASAPPTTLLLLHHALKRLLPSFPHQQGRQGPKKKAWKFFGRRKTNRFTNRSLFLDITKIMK